MAGRPEKEGDTGMAPVVTMRQLLESGVHFGHQTRRWNPKMKRFIFTERNGIYIIDLQQSLAFIDHAYDFIKETVAHGGSVLYVGTKKQAQEAIAEQARRVGMPFVNQRWLGGMLTNFGTVYKRLQRLKELEEIDFDDVAGSNLTKKELLQLRRERDKLERSLGGIRDMSRVPSALWVVDTKKEHIAVSEARKLGIPVIAILDTNCDPDEVQYPIPGNDDAIRSVALLTRVIADAVADGLIARAGAAATDDKPAADGLAEVGAAEPLAEWERELLEGKADAAAEAAHANGTAPAAPAATDSAVLTDSRRGCRCGRLPPTPPRRLRPGRRAGRGHRRQRGRGHRRQRQFSRGQRRPRRLQRTSARPDSLQVRTARRRAGTPRPTARRPLALRPPTTTTVGRTDAGRQPDSLVRQDAERGPDAGREPVASAERSAASRSARPGRPPPPELRRQRKMGTWRTTPPPM